MTLLVLVRNRFVEAGAFDESAFDEVASFGGGGLGFKRNDRARACLRDDGCRAAADGQRSVLTLAEQSVLTERDDGNASGHGTANKAVADGARQGDVNPLAFGIGGLVFKDDTRERHLVGSGGHLDGLADGGFAGRRHKIPDDGHAAFQCCRASEEDATRNQRAAVLRHDGVGVENCHQGGKNFKHGVFSFWVAAPPAKEGPVGYAA